MDSAGTVPFDHNMQVRDVNSLINDIYPNLDNIIPPPIYFLDRVILAPRNCDVDELNSAILSCFPGELYTFHSADSVQTEPDMYTDTYQIPVEFLRSIKASGLSPGELRLKCGCPLILLRNLCSCTRVVQRHTPYLAQGCRPRSSSRNPRR